MIKRRNRTASLRHEHEYYAEGFVHIIGIDEAGRGPWAGPVTAGAVCLPLENANISKILKGVRDSKQMTPRQRAALAEAIKETALVWGIGSASPAEIDELRIIKATKLAMQRALEMAVSARPGFAPDCLFLDAMLWPEMKHLPQVSLVGGDQRSLSIAAASVLAKTWRDDYMLELDAEFPQYGFAVHKGYGTPRHLEALRRYGPSPVHRQHYEPIRKLSESERQS